MKKFKLISATVLLSIAFTQKMMAQSSNGMVSFSLGPSIPIGNFSNSELSNSDAGWANTGSLIDFSFAQKLGNSKFGIIAKFRSQANPLDNKSLTEEYENQTTGAICEVNSKPWSTGAILVGGFASLPISNKIYFDPKALIGFSGSISPDISVDITSNGYTGWVIQNGQSASAFAFMVGAGFRFEVGKRCYILAEVDYLNTTPGFRNIEVASSMGEKIKFNSILTLQTINTSVGLGIKL